jgi:hypothetical protein
MSQSDCESYLIIVIESKQKGHESEISEMSHREDDSCPRIKGIK